MKKMIGLVIAFSTAALLADYITFTGANNNSLSPTGGVSVAGNWIGGALPSGSSTGLVNQTGNVWAGTTPWADFSLLQTGGYINGGTNPVPMRHNVKYIIDDARKDYSTYTNYAGSSIMIWVDTSSSAGAPTEISLLRGHIVLTGTLTMNSAGGVVNIKDGLFKMAGFTGSNSGRMNFLTGGDGEVVIDKIMSTGMLSFFNFETGFTGSLTINKANDDARFRISHFNSWMKNGKIMIDGVVQTDPSKFKITGGTIELIPE